MLVCLIVLIGVIYLMFVYCFQGMNEVAHGREVKRVFAENDGQDDFDLKLDAEEVDPKFRYCTEFVVELVNCFILLLYFIPRDYLASTKLCSLRFLVLRQTRQCYQLI